MVTQPREDMHKALAGDNQWLDFRNKGFTKEETELLVRILNEAPHLIRLTLQNCWFHDDGKAVMEALGTRRDLEEIRIQRLQVEPEILAMLPEAVGNNPSLRVFAVEENTMPTAVMTDFGHKFQNAASLRHLSFERTDLTDESAAPLFDAAIDNPGITGLCIGHNKLTDASVPRILNFIHDRPQLLTLKTKTSAFSEENAQKLEDALLSEPHPNLMFLEMPFDHNITRLDSFIRSNDRAMQEVRNRISKSVMVRMDQEDVWAATQLGPSLDNVGPWVRKHYHTITEAYPSIGKDEAVTLDALFKADENGFCPIDNPRTWSTHPDLLAKLGARGELTEETLAHTTGRGHSLLQHALGFTPLASDVVGALNDYGIQLQHDQLFTEEGTPTPIMDLFAQRRQVAALFSPENWVGEPASKLRGTMDKAQAVSPKEAFPNRHTLLASIGRLNRANGFEGMAR